MSHDHDSEHQHASPCSDVDNHQDHSHDHGHADGHGHAHHGLGHHHEPAEYNRAFAIGVLLNSIYIAVEAGYGFATNSLALLADAGHNLSDVLSLLLAWGAHYLSSLAPSGRRTYGWRSTSILAALLNALLLLVAIGGIAWEAIARIGSPTEVAGGTLAIVAGIGVAINLGTALLFFGGRHDDLNIKGAYLHMAADAAVSLAVVLSGVAIATFGWSWLDPAISLTIAVVIFLGTWSLLKASVNLALHAVPDGINPAEVEQVLLGLPGVAELHDLHIWGMSTTETALTAHIVRPESSNDDDFLREATRLLKERFCIAHTTIQIERSSEHSVCPQANAGCV